MPLTTAQRTRLNDFLTALATKVIALQTAYYNGLEVVTPTSKDLDGKDVPATTRQRNRYCQLRRQTLSNCNFADRPTDQRETWVDFGLARLADLPDKTDLDSLSIEVSPYDGPRGKGWLLILTIEINSKTYRRVVNRGPETWCEQVWREIVDAPI